MKSTVPPLCALSLTLMLSCGESDAQEVDIPLAATVEEVYTVGAFAGDDWELFGAIANVSFDAHGNLHILDEGAYRVVVVDRHGQFLRTVGSQGEGPGELAGPAASAVLDDGRLVVFDMGFPGAFEIFDAEGRFVSSTPVDILAGMPGQLLLPLPDGRLVSTGGMKVSMAGQGDEAEPEVDDHLRDIDVFSLDGSNKEVVYRAWNLPPTEQVEELTATNQMGQNSFSLGLNRPRAFTPRLHLGVLSDGRIAVVDSIGYTVKLIAVDGSVDATVSRPIAPERVTQEIQEAERARRIEGLSGAAASGSLIRVTGREAIGGEFAEQLREHALAQVEAMLFPDEIPVIADMAVDLEDRIWVARTAAGGAGDGPVDLVRPSGEYIGTLPPEGPRIPTAFGPDGLMAYVETDEMDVPTVRVMRLVSVER